MFLKALHFLPVKYFTKNSSFRSCSLSSCTDRLRKKFYLHEPQMQINDAVTACRHNYTDLVTIYDQEENVKQAKGNCSWIRANACTWSNGDPVTFIKLTRNFPEERCCGALTAGGTWECFNCSSTKMYFMCDKQGNHILIPENKTWFEAQLYCKNNQSDLVSIRSETENEQVKEAVNGNNSFWIGLSIITKLHGLMEDILITTKMLKEYALHFSQTILATKVI